MEVGKVSKVEPVGGDSPAVVVTMKMKDEALPIHKDATIKVRPRLFFEGNLFFDVKPGTPQAGDVDDGDTIPVTQTSAPVQLDQVLGILDTNTREDLRKLLVGYGNAINGKPLPGEDADQDPDTKGETAGKSLNDTYKYAAQSLRGGAIVNDATLGTELHDLSKLIGGQQKIFARAVVARGLAQGPHHQLQHDDGRARVAGGEPAAPRSASCRGCSRPRGRRSTT